MAKVLVIEDNAVTLETLETLLALDGHEVTGAANGHAALTRLALRAPDVILLDWRMPGMGGREFLGELARRPEQARAKVVVMSALADDELADLPEGVALLRKPFDPAELAKILKAVDGKKRRMPRGAAGG